jgi:hypothetical protein
MSEDVTLKHVTANFKGEFVYLSFTLIGSTLLLKPTFEPVDLLDDEAKDVAAWAHEDEMMSNVTVIAVST